MAAADRDRRDQAAAHRAPREPLTGLHRDTPDDKDGNHDEHEVEGREGEQE